MGIDVITGFENWWLTLSDHLGAVYPAYDIERPNRYSLDIADIISARGPETLKIDPVAMVSKVSLPYVVGDRTLFEGIKRAPFMARPDEFDGWIEVDLPKHRNLQPETEHHGELLYKALQCEIREYIEGCSSVGVLLSGGLDSRIVAGLLRECQVEDGFPERVYSLSWGVEGSRDVEYAKEIARRFDWDFVHLPLNSSSLKRNIESSAENGAEVSALHLHAMPDVADLDGLDAILAGSYGDSVGRAEFSGKHLTELTSIAGSKIDPFGILKRSVVEEFSGEFKKGIRESAHFNNVGELGALEIEQEMHYMRRMLQHCMLHIAKKIPLYQLFTRKDVVSLMWSLEPKSRGDQWYKYILAKLPGDIGSLPWARTGRKFPDGREVQDNFPKMYHQYGYWLRNDLGELLWERVNSEQIKSLGVFNHSALVKLFYVFQKSETMSTSMLDELFCWLASVYSLVEQSRPASTDYPADTFKGYLHATKGNLYARSFVYARNKIRS